MMKVSKVSAPPVRVCWPRRNQTRQLMGIVHLPLPPQDSGTRCHLILGTHSLLVSLSLYWKHISLNVRISCICNLLGYWHSLFYIFSNYCKRIEACEMRTKNCYYYYGDQEMSYSIIPWNQAKDVWSTCSFSQYNSLWLHKWVKRMWTLTCTSLLQS